MKIRNMLGLAAAVALVSILPLRAHAQTDLVNCAGLSGMPAICFKNNSPVPITGIITSSSMAWGSDWTTPPGPPCQNVGVPCIMPGATSVIKLPTGWTGMKIMAVKTADKAVHPINHGQPFDVYRTVSVTVGAHEW